MPKKQSPESPQEQSERFRREAQKLIDAGELNPTEAEIALSDIIYQVSTPKSPKL